MDDLDKFCNIVKNRSEENEKTIKLLYENKLYRNCVSILRQELDSMVRVLFLLTCEQAKRMMFVKQTLNDEKWHDGKRTITDALLLKNVLKMCGWARNVYLFGCSFIHLSACHNYMQEDPFLKLSLEEHNAIKNFMVQYHNFPKEQNITFITMQPYLLTIFEKISDNLKCHLENLNKNPSETNIM